MDDAAVLGEDSSNPIELAARVASPTLVVSGGASPPFMSDTARKIAEVIPNARLLVLEGQARCAARGAGPSAGRVLLWSMKRMTYKAYIDNIQAETGMTTEDFRKLASEKGLVKYGRLPKWLRQTAGLAMGMPTRSFFTYRTPNLPRGRRPKVPRERSKTGTVDMSPQKRKEIFSDFKLVIRGRQKEGQRQ